MFSLKPKEDIFFELFLKAAKNAHLSSQELHILLNNYEDAEVNINNIVRIESDGDAIRYEIEKKLLDTFITPFDREDIYLIAKKIDKYVNNMQTIALGFKIFHITEITEYAKQIGAQLVHMTEQLIILMDNLKDKKNSKIVKDAITDINISESEVDKLYRNAISELFENPTDVLHVIKWKEMYQFLENTADSCEDIANTIEGVVTKNE